jgi:histidine decarboxylase
MRYIESDQDLTLRGDRLLEAIAKDKDKGLIPFFVSTDASDVGEHPVLF